MVRDACVASALQKSVDLVLALGFEDGTGAVEEPAAGLQGGPQGVEEPGLDLCQGRDVGGAAQPAHVGVAAHDARRGARGVEQDGVEGAAVPPRGRVGGVGGLGAGAQVQALQCLVDAREAGRGAVEGEEVEGGQLQQEGGLSPRSGAGVQDAGARSAASTIAACSRRKRRSTAFTNDALPFWRCRAAVTAWSTSVWAAYGGSLRGHSRASDTSSKASTGGAGVFEASSARAASALP